jgi:hypothetical protein
MNLLAVFLLGNMTIFDPLRCIIDHYYENDYRYIYSSIDRNDLIRKVKDALLGSINCYISDNLLSNKGINYISVSITNNPRNKINKDLFGLNITDKDIDIDIDNDIDILDIVSKLVVEINLMWPLNEVFHSDALVIYNSALRLLLKLSILKWKSEKIWKLSMFTKLFYISSKKGKNNRQIYSKNDELKRKCLSGLAILLHRVNIIYNNIMTSIHSEGIYLSIYLSI